MEFRILGGLEAEADGIPVALGGPREQKVLALLLLDAGNIVPIRRLIDAVWEDDPPATAVKQVRNAVSRLRSSLTSGGCPGAITAHPAGYRLAVADRDIDARVFESLTSRARSAAAEGRVPEAADALQTALALWRGPLLAGLTGRLIEAAATSWEESRRRAEETCYGHLLTLTQHEDMVASLATLVAEQPLREKLATLLILALYRCGRPADALQVYHDTRRALAGELGLEPGHELQRLHQRILARDPGLDAPGDDSGKGTLDGRPAASAALAQTAPDRAIDDRERIRPATLGIPRQLPPATRHFTGRTAELRALNGVLDQATDMAGPEPAASGPDLLGGTVVISAINGTAGIGKTALALYWAHRIAPRFPDGELYVNLRGFDPSRSPVAATEVIHGFLGALGVPPNRIPPALADRVALYRSLLADRRILLVLDNAHDADQVRPLLPGAPGCLVLVTSRNQLTSLVAIEGAQPLTLGLLTTAEARALLTCCLGPERVAREPDAAAELIELCAQLPLALSIAAARAAIRPQLPLMSLAAELRDAQLRLDALSAGDATSDMRSVFSWSYQQLSPAAARMFRLLGMHPGPDISVPAAVSLAGTSRIQARASLDELIQAHLLSEHTPDRYEFHDLLRAYAAEQATAEESETSRRASMYRVLDHYLHSGHAAALQIDSSRFPLRLPAPCPAAQPETITDGAAALAWFQAEYAAVLAIISVAGRTGFDTHAWQLPWTLVHYFDRTSRWHDWLATQQIAVTAAQRTSDLAGQGNAQHYLGYAHGRLGHYRQAHVHLGRAIELFKAAGHTEDLAHTYLDVGWVYDAQGNHEAALTEALRGLAQYQAAGHVNGRARSLSAASWCLTMLGQHHRAQSLAEQALSLYRELDDSNGEAATWDSLGYIHHCRGDYPDALGCYRRAILLISETGDSYRQSIGLTHIADTHAEMGDHAAARAAWQRALSLLEELQHPDADQVRAKLCQYEWSRQQPVMTKR